MLEVHDVLEMKIHSRCLRGLEQVFEFLIFSLSDYIWLRSVVTDYLLMISDKFLGKKCLHRRTTSTIGLNWYPC